MRQVTHRICSVAAPLPGLMGAKAVPPEFDPELQLGSNCHLYGTKIISTNKMIKLKQSLNHSPSCKDA